MVCYNQAADMGWPHELSEINLPDSRYKDGKIYYNLSNPKKGGRGSGTPFMIIAWVWGDKKPKEVLLYGTDRQRLQRGEPAIIETSRFPRAACTWLDLAYPEQLASHT